MHGSADEGDLAVHVLLCRVWLLQPFERQRGCRREPPVARYGGVVDESCDEACHARRSKRVRWPVRRRFVLVRTKLSQPHPRQEVVGSRGWFSHTFYICSSPLRANSRARGPLGIIHEELGIPIKIRGAIVVPCFTQLNRPRPVLHGRIIFAFLRFCSSSVLCRMRWSCFHSEPRVAILRLIFSCLNQIPSAYNRNEVFIVTIACLQVR